MPYTEAEQVCKIAARLFNSTERKNAEAQWNLISEFVLPMQSGLFMTDATTPGAKKTRRVYDSTAIQANHDLAAAIHATLTNPATKWSKIRYKDEALNNDKAAVEWLEEANNRIHRLLNESNFDVQVSKNYQMLTSLATMVLIQDEVSRDEDGEFKGMKFTAWHLAEVCFMENKEGIVDTVYRKFSLTAKQAYERWGNDLPRYILEVLEDKPDKEFKFIHCIKPRDPKKVEVTDFGAPPDKRPFESVYVEEKEKTAVEEGGFFEFPVYVVRWQTMPGEVYGRGPGHIALPDVRTMNQLKKMGLQAMAKAVNPPILSKMRNIIGALNLSPGSINYVKNKDDIMEMVPQTRMDMVQFSIEELKMSIQSTFFLDKLMLPPRTDTGEMTAYEVAQRLEQMQRVLGPTLSRLNNEFLTPLIVRTFKVALRNRLLPPVPAVVQEGGIDVDIVFINQLARSQQIEDVTNIQSWIQELSIIAQVRPEVVDYINADDIAKYTARVRGIPEVAVSNDKDVARVRKDRAEQLQQQQAVEQAVKGADIAAKTSKGGA